MVATTWPCYIKFHVITRRVINRLQCIIFLKFWILCIEYLSLGDQISLDSHWFIQCIILLRKWLDDCFSKMRISRHMPKILLDNCLCYIKACLHFQKIKLDNCLLISFKKTALLKNSYSFWWAISHIVKRWSGWFSPASFSLLIDELCISKLCDDIDNVFELVAIVFTLFYEVTISIFSPLYSDGFSHTYKCNNHGLVHYVFYGDEGWNFQIMMYFCPLQLFWPWQRM